MSSISEGLPGYHRELMFFLICLVFSVPPAGGETIFLCARDESRIVESGNPSAVVEGLLESLFEIGHIVFDFQGGNIWDGGGLKPMIRLAAEGGARYLVAVTVRSRYESISAAEQKLDRVSSSAHYQCYDVRTGLLLGDGHLEENNEGREKEFNENSVGFRLGEGISVEVDRICRRIEKKSSLPMAGPKIRTGESR